MTTYEYNKFRKKNNIPDNTKIFIMSGRYEDLRLYLKSRGWVENLDPKFYAYNLNWALKKKNIDIENLMDF